MMMNGLVWGFILLAMGVVQIAFFRKQIYPQLSAKFEEAKVTGDKTINPQLVFNTLKLVSLVVMPAIFFWFGYNGDLPHLAGIANSGAGQ